jgi:hypothetical protein
MNSPPSRNSWLRRVVLDLIITSTLLSCKVTTEDAGPSREEIPIRKAIEFYVDAYKSGNVSVAASH